MMQTNFYPMYYMQFPQNTRVQPNYRPMMPLKAPNAQQFYTFPQQYQTLPKRDFNQEKINRMNRLNRMKANTKQTKWTPEEEQLLEQKFEELGPHWSRMKYYFPGRTDVNLKNHWSSMMNRKKKEEVMKKISQTDPSEIESPSNEENYDNINTENSIETNAQDIQTNLEAKTNLNNSIDAQQNDNKNKNKLNGYGQTEGTEQPNDFNRNTSYDNLFNNLYEEVDVDCCLPTFNAIDF